jgi:hypothetical protein
VANGVAVGPGVAVGIGAGVDVAVATAAVGSGSPFEHCTTTINAASSRPVIRYFLELDRPAIADSTHISSVEFCSIFRLSRCIVGSRITSARLHRMNER